ncbi:MAG: hypothetical protein KH047_00300 [Eubacterium sp.]|nr:hypothetical protein [Eubacterium sp.]
MRKVVSLLLVLAMVFTSVNIHQVQQLKQQKVGNQSPGLNISLPIPI